MSIWLWAILIAAALLFLLKLTYVFCTAMVITITRGATFVTTAKVRIKTFLKNIQLEDGSTFVDLGCGDGRILRSVSEQKNLRLIGYEINLFAYFLSRLLCFGYRDIEIKNKSFWKADLSEADVVFCYLFPDVMGDLTQKLIRELKPGSMVISCNFPLKGEQPLKVLRPQNTRHNEPIFIYRLDH